MLGELKADLEFSKTYLNSLVGINKDTSLDLTIENINKALNLIKLINERLTIAEAKSNNAPLPEARSWKDIKLEYDALYHLERLYNNNEDISNL